jgi:hypothetical protein
LTKWPNGGRFAAILRDQLTILRDQLKVSREDFWRALRDPLARLDMRLTYRTVRVLAARTGPGSPRATLPPRAQHLPAL